MSGYLVASSPARFGAVGMILLISVATSGRADENLAGLHFCTQLSLPAHKQAEAMEIADKVSPLHFVRANVSKGMHPATPRLAVQIAALWQKKWQHGSEITVGFLNGEPAVQNKVEIYAHKWEELELRRLPSPAKR